MHNIVFLWASTDVTRVQRTVINVVFTQEFYHQQCHLREVLGRTGEQGRLNFFLVKFNEAFQ